MKTKIWCWEYLSSMEMETVKTIMTRAAAMYEEELDQRDTKWYWAPVTTLRR